ncbi:MAG: Cation/multidrug efflux pump [Ignavibacteria bacterium]|nr:MAG: Cation/multidrug efflux pump [Ignavibacteria bacterium]
MKKVFHLFLLKPVTTGMFFLSVLVIGIVAAFNLPIELTPNVEYPSLSITVSWRGVSPEAVEAHLTSPIEAELATIMGVKKISSTSTEGNASISIDFHPETDINFARIEINEKLSSLRNSLPDGVSAPRVTPYVPKDFRDLQGFITYSVSANRTANEVRKYLLENVLLPLKAIDGVSNVEIRGGNNRLIEIILDYNKVRALDIKNEEITNAVNEAEIIKSAGKIIYQEGQIFLKINNSISNPLDIQEQIVKILPNGQTIRIRDISKINDDFEEPQSYYRINGKETVTINISKEPGSNTLLVANAVMTKMDELGSKFPTDYTYIKEIDKSEDIKKDLDELYRDGLYSVIIIFLVILIIFRDKKYPFIILSSLVFSFLSAFILFFIFNISLNIITIASFIVGFGFKVDNAIVVLDYLEKHYDGKGIRRLTVLLKEIFLPLFTSTFTIIALFIPLVFLTGELKLYFVQFALGIASTLFASLVVSFTVVPLLFRISYNSNKAVKYKSDEVNLGAKFYSYVVEKIIKHKKISIAFLILVIGMPVWEIPSRIEKESFIAEAYNSLFDSEAYQEIRPYLNYALGGGLNLFFNHVSRGEMWRYGEETYLSIRLELPNGNKIERINKLCHDLEKEILSYKKNIKVLIANVIDEETAYLKVEFTPEQANTAFPFLLKNYVTAYATRLGGVDSYVYGFGPGFSNAGGGSSSMFNVTVKGFNYERVKEIAEKFRERIKRNPRVDNVDIDRSKFYWSDDTYEIVAKIERDKLKAYDISVAELFSIVAKNSGGNIGYQRFRINNDEVDYRVKFSNYDNVQLKDLENLVVNERKNENLKIKDLLKFEEQKVLSAINREDQQYVRNISFEFKGPYKFGSKFLESSIASMNVHEGYSIKPAEFTFMFGEKEELDLLIVFAAAILVILMICAALFESFKKPLIILTSIPFALVGSVFLFWLGNYSIERGAYAGMLLLIGLSVSNSIVMINYLSENVKYFTTQEIIQLSTTRLRAILTTTLTTFTALIPFVLSDDSTFWRNLSLSIIGGIIVSALYVVIFLPLVFSMFTKHNIYFKSTTYGLLKK